MKFYQFCLQHKVTSDERTELIWFLAMMRFRRTVETL